MATASKKPVKNVDLWQRLDIAASRHQVAWHWIKGMPATPETSGRIGWRERPCRSPLSSDRHQVQAIGRRRWPGGGAVACSQGGGHLVRRPLALTRPFQGADDIAHLMVQERSCAGLDMDLIALAGNGQPVQGFARRFAWHWAARKLVKSW